MAMRGLGQLISKGTPIDTVRRGGLSWPLLLGAVAFWAALITGAARVGPDTYWHIMAGRWILAHGQVPTRDPFSFTMHGAPWVAQEWGAELLMTLVDGMTGLTGLVLLSAALFALADGNVSFRLARKRNFDGTRSVRSKVDVA